MHAGEEVEEEELPDGEAMPEAAWIESEVSQRVGAAHHDDAANRRRPTTAWAPVKFLLSRKQVANLLLQCHCRRWK